MKATDNNADSSDKNDRAIFEYLNQMLQDPVAGAATAEKASSPEKMARERQTEESPPPDGPSLTSDHVVAPNYTTRPLPTTPPTPKPAAEPLAQRKTLLSESLFKTIPETNVELVAEVEPVPEVEPAPVAQAPELISKETSRAQSSDSLEPADSRQESAVEADIDFDADNDRLPELAHCNTIWCDNGRPSWAHERFECLIFNVAGLKLAVPLVTLGAIYEIDRRFNTLPGQCDWFIGILNTHNAGNIKVLDTALCVMPERYDVQSRDSLSYVITIHGYSWGLACHQVEKSITLEPDHVKWRTQRGKRPWLAGTVVDYMCSLIDTDGFQALNRQAEASD